MNWRVEEVGLGTNPAMIKSSFWLKLRIRGVAFLFVSLLILGCGGEESVHTPIVDSDGDENPTHDVLTSTPYYPTTLGSRWVYRNADGSEWTREVTETKNFGDNLYYYFASNPPIQNTQIESLKSPVYVKFHDRLVRRINPNDIDAVVLKIIVDSGGETPSWGLGMSCNNRVVRKGECVSKKDKSTPGIMTYLYRSNTGAVWHSKLTPFPIPLVPGETYEAFNLRLKGRHEGPFHIHAYDAEGVILGKVSDDSELVEVPAGAFEDCLRIQYEAKLTSYNTVEFKDVTRILMPVAYRKTVESDVREELTDLLMHLTSKLELHTVWLAPGVGPVKLETRNGTAELIDYAIK